MRREEQTDVCAMYSSQRTHSGYLLWRCASTPYFRAPNPGAPPIARSSPIGLFGLTSLHPLRSTPRRMQVDEFEAFERAFWSSIQDRSEGGDLDLGENPRLPAGRGAGGPIARSGWMAELTSEGGLRKNAIEAA